MLTTTQSSLSICESVNVFNQDSFKYIKDEVGRVDSAVVKFNDSVSSVANTHNVGGDVKSIVVYVISDELNSLLTEAYNSIYLQEGDGGSP